VEKLAAGSVDFDVWFPTIDVLPKMVVAKLIQPLNLSYIPNLQANVWPQLADPFYDRGSHYSVPYTVYTTGMAYRRDEIDDEAIAGMANPYEIFWNTDYRGKTGIYDSYRDAMGMVLLKNGITDVNTENPGDIDTVKDDLFSLIDAVNIKATINGTYAKMPEGEFWLHQAWSGDLVYGLYQLPEGVTSDVLGYWWPQDHRGLIGSDSIAIPRSATNPVLAHHFLNFMLDQRQAIYNFNWNLYQPPQNVIDPDELVANGTVPAHLPSVVVQPEYFDTGYQQGGLPPPVEDLWLAAWNEFKAGV
jgi:spermidine/putrescine transport system substrate-binding protein